MIGWIRQEVDTDMADFSRTSRRWAGAGVGALGVGLMVLASPAAAADPAIPAEPAPAPVELVDPAAVPADLPAAAAAPTSLDAPAPDAPAGPEAAAVEGVSHLPSPDALPPGTTQTPPDSGRLGYLRDLWHAVRTQDVTMTDAFLLFAQRPVDTKSIAPGSMSPHPQTPVGPPAGPVLPEQVADPASAPEAGSLPLPEAVSAPGPEAGAAEAVSPELPVPPAS